MEKVPTLFKRDYEGTRLVYNEVVSGCEWVMAGEGVATLKLDGTSCLVRDGKLYKRFELKKGKQSPPNFEPAQEPDPVIGDTPGWIMVSNIPEDKWHLEAWRNAWENLPDGTYELMGPKVQGNSAAYATHVLIRHGAEKFKEEPPRDFEGLREWLGNHVIEGIVWHHPDGRMAKLKRRDFGYKWPASHQGKEG